MELIRIIQASYHFDWKRKRFKSTAFSSSSRDGAVSAIDKSCIIQTGNTICSHIRRYYGRLADESPIFFEHLDDILPDGCTIEKIPSTTGDKCHVNIKGISKRQARRIAKELEIEDYSICLADETVASAIQCSRGFE